MPDAGAAGTADAITDTGTGNNTVANADGVQCADYMYVVRYVGSVAVQLV